MTRRFIHLETCESTNAWARVGIERGELLGDAVVWTDEQTAGRGTRGRAWLMPAKRALAVSIVVDATHLRRVTRLTILSAVAVRRALMAHGCTDATLKWPNDIMRGEAKVGGILTEIVPRPDGSALQVVGIGINLALRPGDASSDLARSIGDVDLDCSHAAREAYVTTIVDQLDTALADVGTSADAERSDEYRAASWIIGRDVALTTSTGAVRGRVTDVSADGDIEVDGQRHRAETTRLASVAGFSAG